MNDAPKPHDDIEIGAGGSLLKWIAEGLKVGLADLNRGELGTKGSAEERIEELEAQLAEKTEELTATLSDLEAEKAAHQAVQEAKQQVEATLATTQSDLEDAQTTVESTKKELTAKVAEIETKTGEITELEEQVTGLQEKIEELEKNLEMFKSGGMSLKVQADQAKAKLQKVEGERDAALKELEDLKAALENLDEETREKLLSGT